MINSENIISTKAARPVGPYPHSKKVGQFLFLSGIGPRQTEYDKEGNPTDKIPAEFSEQFISVMQNLKTILAESNLTLENLVDITVYLTDMKAYFKEFNELYKKYFNEKTGPCRTTVEVNALPTPIFVELKCMAYFYH